MAILVDSTIGYINPFVYRQWVGGKFIKKAMTIPREIRSTDLLWATPRRRKI